MTQVSLGPLLTASAEEASAYVDGADPEALVAAVRAAADDEVLALVDRPEVRRAAVGGILARLHEYADADRLAVLHGSIRFDLAQHDRVVERHVLVVDHGRLELVPDVADDEPADVVLATSVLGFVRLVSGERNAGLELLGGGLDVVGDTDLALALGGIFVVPGTDRVAVDPTRLDPVDVATVLAHGDEAHLRRVMSSGFRPVVLDEIFRRLPEFVDARKAARCDLTVGFRLLGAPDGEVERRTVRVLRGLATVTAGDEGEERDATVTCEGHDFVRLATGHLSAVAGVLRGRLKVRGDKAKALKLADVIDFPRAR
ncbi:SCP2 sterol-binding domain-containing protein [Nocardioides lianchengensis]|uniref:SCP-2 sterol transfer family protein n=1 Tax=Nocardioides lianchengensis TaxID=1045774 RepID=A0A1G6RF03_9ACTN|nr:SCP2 sterol-binding domain-containing protein [Nocardioides lianchengensis]NYG10277.1 putative sterol carrier protein [Nocardioides lianchengensis]SDD02476.1 SCP-2 sterol transfer family protein [Nocardioides lianchengensis]